MVDRTRARGRQRTRDERPKNETTPPRAAPKEEPGGEAPGRGRAPNQPSAPPLGGTPQKKTPEEKEISKYAYYLGCERMNFGCAHRGARNPLACARGGSLCLWAFAASWRGVRLRNPATVLLYRCFVGSELERLIDFLPMFALH